MRIKQMIIHSKMKNKILPTCLQGNYTESLEELQQYVIIMACLHGLRGL